MRCMRSSFAAAPTNRTGLGADRRAFGGAGLSAVSRTVYVTPDFLSYFEQATPLNEIGSLKIASRPARRNSVQGIDQLRAIPWVFQLDAKSTHLPGW